MKLKDILPILKFTHNYDSPQLIIQNTTGDTLFRGDYKHVMPNMFLNNKVESLSSASLNMDETTIIIKII